jgi:hypothetical protein
MARETRKKSLHVRVSTAEHWVLGQLAEMAGTSRSDYVRQLLCQAAELQGMSTAPVDVPVQVPDDRQVEMFVLEGRAACG